MLKQSRSKGFSRDSDFEVGQGLGFRVQVLVGDSGLGVRSIGLGLCSIKGLKGFRAQILVRDSGFKCGLKHKAWIM